MCILVRFEVIGRHRGGRCEAVPCSLDTSTFTFAQEYVFALNYDSCVLYSVTFRGLKGVNFVKPIWSFYLALLWRKTWFILLGSFDQNTSRQMHQSQTVLGFSSLGAVSVCVGVCAVFLFPLSESVHAACVYASVCVRTAGLAFDSWDLDYYTSMFQRINRNPTSVECFDLAQSNRWGGGIPAPCEHLPCFCF